MALLNSEFQQIIEKLNIFTREGKRSEVIENILLAIKNKPSLIQKVQLANLANRNTSPMLAMKILARDILYSDKEYDVEEEEIYSAWATSLLQIGALEDAEKYLLKTKTLKTRYLTNAFINFARWDYIAAIPHLKKFIKNTQINDYQKLIGELNLAASYVSIADFKNARKILSYLIPRLKIENSTRILYGNSIELAAQIEILTKNFPQAKVFLDEAKYIFKENKGRYLQYVLKWDLILKLTQDPNNLNFHKEFFQVRNNAIIDHDWETVRDCDFHFSRLTNNKNLLRSVCLGTPYKGFKDRIAKHFNIVIKDAEFSYVPGVLNKIPDRITWTLDQNYDRFDLSEGNFNLIELLTRDIYKPPRVGEVFNKLYPGEVFNPFTSPGRVANTILRFNKWSKNNNEEFLIKIIEGDFILNGNSMYGIKRFLQFRNLNYWILPFNKLKKVKKGKTFSSDEFAKILMVSKRQANLLLKQALIKKLITKLSNGKSTRYIFKSTSRKSFNSIIKN